MVEIVVPNEGYKKRGRRWDERWKDSIDAAKAMLAEAGVKIRRA
jgi:hypothetical protein